MQAGGSPQIGVSRIWRQIFVLRRFRGPKWFYRFAEMDQRPKAWERKFVPRQGTDLPVDGRSALRFGANNARQHAG
jgi:hypothetical protein